MYRLAPVPDTEPGDGRRALLDPEQLLQRLEWTVVRRLDGMLQGDYRTLFRGFGLDLAELREYQLHDDVRYIDWNVTARLQVPYVRQYNEDREITAWFLLDLSPSVDFGSAGRDKRTVLLELVAVLTRLLTRHGNRVGAIVYGDGVQHVVPARGGRNHVLHLLHTLQQAPRLASSRATSLYDLLQTAVRQLRRRSMVFLVSDFMTEPGWEPVLGHLAQRHELLAVRLLDPLELQLPDLGMLFMRDAETGEQLLVDSGDRAFRARYAARAESHRAAVRSGCAAAGVDALELSTRDDLVDALVRYVGLRKRSAALANAGSGANTGAGAGDGATAGRSVGGLDEASRRPSEDRAGGAERVVPAERAATRARAGGSEPAAVADRPAGAEGAATATSGAAAADRVARAAGDAAATIAKAAAAGLARWRRWWREE